MMLVLSAQNYHWPSDVVYMTSGDYNGPGENCPSGCGTFTAFLGVITRLMTSYGSMHNNYFYVLSSFLYSRIRICKWWLFY